MKVERSVPIDQRSQRSATSSVVNATSQIPTPPANPAMQDLRHQSIRDSQLPTPERFDADLPFERDELLKPDGRVPPHGPQVWQVKELPLKLSALEATVAVKGGVFTYDDFKVQVLISSPLSLEADVLLDTTPPRMKRSMKDQLIHFLGPCQRPSVQSEPSPSELGTILFCLRRSWKLKKMTKSTRK